MKTSQAIPQNGLRRLTQAELTAEARAAFGNDPKKWAFRCPSCGDVASIQDFIDAGVNQRRIGQECIGRLLGALPGAPSNRGGRSRSKRGCNRAAYGLISGPWFVEIPVETGGTTTVPAFPLAVGGAS